MTTQGYINTRWERVQDYDIPSTQISERIARKIPKTSDVKYNEIVNMELGIVYVDIQGFSKLVDEKNNRTVSRIMTIYVTEIAAAIRNHGGSILDIQGDGILAAFPDKTDGDRNAVTSCLRASGTMQTSMKFIVNRKIQQFQQEPLSCRYGMDFGKILIIKAGVRGQDKNDLVFIGNPINRAVKLQAETSVNHFLVTDYFYRNLIDYFKDEENGWKWTPKNLKYGKVWEKKFTNYSGIEESN